MTMSRGPAGQRFKQLLVINDYPPSGSAGAPIFARQLFNEYDPDRLDVICCSAWHKHSTQLLPCRHTVVQSYTTNLRPRRLFRPIEATLNVTRLGKIMRLGREIARERGVEAIFTTSYGAEMPHAAYFLSKELGVPLYYFEMDRLDAVFECASARRLIMQNRAAFLRHVKKLWVISPAMAREFQREFGVESEALHHFIDVDKYQSVAASVAPRNDGTFRVVFTGSILLLLYDALAWFCRQLNAGLTIEGRPVELHIYSQGCPPELLGPRVKYQGYVPLAEVPRVIAEADAGLVCSGFDVSPGVRAQIETSVSTKTVDYIAAGRPVLAIATQGSGQVDYYGHVCAVVDRLDPELLSATLKNLTDEAYLRELNARALDFIRRRHSLPVLRERFLSHFYA